MCLVEYSYTIKNHGVKYYFMANKKRPKTFLMLVEEETGLRGAEMARMLKMSPQLYFHHRSTNSFPVRLLGRLMYLCEGVSDAKWRSLVQVAWGI